MQILDYSQVAISTIMVELKGRTDIELEPSLVRHMIINAIRAHNVRFRKEFGQMVIACDSKKYWRRDIFPHYKAGRKKTRDESGLDWNAIYDILNQVKAELSVYFPYPVIEVERVEADDIIASLVKWTQTNETISGGMFGDEPQPVVILSGDHDFQQLQKYENVRQYAPVQKTWVKADISPSEVLMEHIIYGDKGDGVPNIFSPDDVFVSGGRQKPVMKKKVEVWRTMTPEAFLETLTPEQQQNFHRNRRLVDMEFIPAEYYGQVIDAFQQQRGKDKSRLMNYFIKHRMKNLMETLNDF